MSHPLPPSLQRHALAQRCVGLVLFVVTPFAALLAQTPSPTSPEMAAFESLRSQFQRQVLSQSQTLSEQYERALARLELERAQSGDYEEAAQIKERRDQIQALFQAGGISLLDPLAIPLSAAAVKGNGIVTNADGSIAGWRSSSHFAEWANVKIVPGDHYLELEYLMLDAPIVTNSGVIRAEPTALFEFFEVSLLAGASENRRSFEINLGRDSTAYTPLRIGPINFTRSPLTLRLVASRSYPGNVMRMKNLRLVPATAQTKGNDAGPPTPVPSDPSKALAALRTEFANALATAYQPINSDYSTQLQNLLRAQPQWKTWIEAEQRLIARQSNGKTPKPSAVGLPRPLASLGSIAGSQDWPEARFVPHDQNTGDRFLVQAEDQTFTIRLQWIRCAPPSPTDQPTAAAEFSKHFSIASEDSALFGRAAKEFTSGYLEGKTFRLLTRTTADSDGSYPALLFLPDVGIYQNVLIDQGLAAVIGKSSSTNGTLERALLRSLIEREQDAKNRDLRPGAWALSRSPSAPKP
jgi:hypothetical protein